MKIDEKVLEAVARALAPRTWDVLDTVKEGSPIEREIAPQIRKSVEDARTAIEAYEAAKGAQDPRKNYAPWQCSMCGARAEGPDSEPYCSCGSKRFARTWIS